MPKNPAAARIIVLDDESEIRGMLQRFLSGQGFEVRTAISGAQLDGFLERHRFDLLILDVMMPDEDGLSVCRRLRAQGHTIPILMLTAKGDPIDKVVGLEMGADDYLAKPFLPGELAARVRAILRRQQMAARQENIRGARVLDDEPRCLRFGPFVLDIGRLLLLRDDQSRVELGDAEMRLLCALAETPNRPVGRENLIDRARGANYEANARSVDVQVLRLRQAIEAEPGSPRYVRTVWGVGYMLVADAAP